MLPEDGLSLSDRYLGEKISEIEALGIIRGVARTVELMYRRSISHWDITPYNIWITPGNNTTLFDFEFAFRTKEEYQNRYLFMYGTKNYVRDGSRGVDLSAPAVDALYLRRQKEEIYSLGLIFRDLVVKLVIDAGLKIRSGESGRIIERAISYSYDSVGAFLRDVEKAISKIQTERQSKCSRLDQVGI